MRLRSGRTISENQQKVYEYPKDKIYIKQNIQMLMDVIESNRKTIPHNSYYYVIQSKHVAEIFTLIKNNFDIFKHYPKFINISGNRAVYLLRDLSSVINKGYSIQGDRISDFQQEQKTEIKTTVKCLIDYLKFVSSNKMLKIK